MQKEEIEIENNETHIEGSVENVTYKNENNGYIVLQIECNKELVTVVGNLGDIEVGEGLILEGEYIMHPKFGRQFQAEYCERKLPDTAVNIQRYLSSGSVSGIGPALAKKIVAVFGEKTLEIMEKTPDRLSEVKGISPKKCREIADEVHKLFALRRIMTYLSGYGAKAQYAMRTHQKFGDGACGMIQANPYLLCSSGIEMDFARADDIARDVGISRNAPERILAGINHILTLNAQAGHTCLPLESLAKLTLPILRVSEPDFYEGYNHALEEKQLFEYIRNEREYVYMTDYYYAERYIADKIKILSSFASPSDYNYDVLINIEEEEKCIKYEKLQRQAITSAISKGLTVLTGGPGTGKTTTLNAMISIFQKQGNVVMLTAPTGRAAKRMSDLTGCEAMTIHRLLEVQFDKCGKPVFMHSEDNPLLCDVIIIDEMSMVDVLLFESLLRAIRFGCKIVMVGDINQLPSVGPGNVLKDIINSGIVSVTHLTEIFRQAKESCIVTNAHKIVTGEYPDLSQKSNDFFFFSRSDYGQASKLIAELAKTRLPNAYKYSPYDDIQILTPSRIGIMGSVELNKMLQEEINPPSKSRAEMKSVIYTFRDGDKIMQTRNNYDLIWKRYDGEEGAGIFNGDIGKILKINRASQEVIAVFDGRTVTYTYELMAQVELAYAVTVHKSQGCEFEAVIIPVMGGFEKLEYRNLLYTAITRAKKLLVLIGREEKVREMVDNNKRNRRYSCLKCMMVE